MATATGICPHCQTPNKTTDIMCSMCGARLPWATPAHTSAAGQPAATGGSLAAGQTQSWKREFDGRLHPVQVSANVVNWPCICCCCGASLPPPTGARPVEQVMAVRMSVNTWRPHYCDQCNQHVLLANQAASANNSSSFPMFNCGCAPIIGIITMLFLAGATNSSMFAFIIGVMVTIGLIAFGREFSKNAKTDPQSKLKSATNATTPDCAHYNPAWWIAASKGSLRRFVFRNEKFAKLFAELNNEKIVY